MTLIPKKQAKFLAKKLAKPKRAAQQPQKQPSEVLRPVQFTSFRFYSWYSRLWNVLFATLVIDIFLLFGHSLFGLPKLGQEFKPYGEGILFGLLVVSFFGFVKEFAIRLMSNWPEVKRKIYLFISKNSAWVALGVTVLFVLETVIKFAQINFIAVLIALFVAVGSFRSLKESYASGLKKQAAFKDDLALQIEAFNFKVFLIHVIPLVASRLTILLTVLLAAFVESPSWSLLLAGLCGILCFSTMSPAEEHFMVSCRRCGRKTSRFLASAHACLECLLSTPAAFHSALESWNQNFDFSLKNAEIKQSSDSKGIEATLASQPSIASQPKKDAFNAFKQQALKWPFKESRKSPSK